MLLWRLPLAPFGLGRHRRLSDLSVVIPARNEENALPRLMVSLARQSVRPREIIVVDDASSDGTARVAGAAEATLLRVEGPPPGWTGKCWACWVGAEAAEGGLLLFLDADTWLEPDGLADLLDAYSLEPSGLLSVYPYQTLGRWHEHLSGVCHIVALMGVGAFTALGRRLRAGGAFGPCILCSREEYVAVGGHEAVKGHIAEDVALASLFSKRKLPVRCLGGRGVVSTRMYSDLGELIQGWGKNLASGARSARVPLLLLVVLWLGGGLGALWATLSLAAHGEAASVGWAGALLAGYAAQTGNALRRIGRFGLGTALAYPALLLFFLVLFAYSAIATFLVRRVRWAGREVPVTVFRRER